MKKGLSVLLILAALFGFYGGATNLNDVLDCKEYWEEKGKQTTADLNKLEDGINQLKDNEQAYLDGQGALADGEKALADGEAKLADGAKKLADGRAKLSNGRKDLAEALVNRAKLASVKKKIQDVEDAYKPWLKKFNKLTASIVDNPKNPTKGVLYDAGATGVGLGQVNAGIQQIEEKANTGKETAEQGIAKLIAGVKRALGEGATDEDAVEAIMDDERFAAQKEQYLAAQEGIAQAEAMLELYAYLNGKFSGRMTDAQDKINKDIANIKEAEYQATALRDSSLNNYAKDAESIMDDFLNDPLVKAKSEALESLIAGANQVKGLAAAAKKSTAQYNKDYDELKPNANMGKKIGKAVAAASKAILGNKDIASSLSSDQKQALKPYTAASSITGLPNIELLYGTMTLGADKKDDGKNSLLDSFRKIKDGASGGLKKYDDGIAAGKKKLAKGESDLAKGEADYAKGEQDLADGRKQLADGKAKLAEYEDGEQQVRDGLATVMGSEANGGLDSIFDRRNGDDDFDNGDKHLELDEGLSAVDTARGYQADSGELITAEIMSRAIGTGLSLAAAALACLAALLGLLKKYKGAGVAALLAAAAGCVGIYQGVSAGYEFSSIAGSTIGNMPWIAAGVLAGVAALHAITHFAAKKDA